MNLLHCCSSYFLHVYLLGNIPDVSRLIESHEAIVHRDLVESRSLFVAEECVRNPDLVPAVLLETDLGDPVLELLELQPRITPRLAQVHAH